jgi:hypothetical protein
MAVSPFLLPAVLGQVMGQVSTAFIGSPTPLENIISQDLSGALKGLT